MVMLRSGYNESEEQSIVMLIQIHMRHTHFPPVIIANLQASVNKGLLFQRFNASHIVLEPLLVSPVCRVHSFKPTLRRKTKIGIKYYMRLTWRQNVAEMYLQQHFAAKFKSLGCCLDSLRVSHLQTLY